MAGRSLRSRLLFGSALWTLGLMVVGAIVAMMLMRFHPELIRLAHGLIISGIALIFMAAGVLQLRMGLVPFDKVRKRLALVREGRARRVDGSYPAEIEPLVIELNALLEHREAIVNRAIAKAGDLAHGLKTPLAVLEREADLAMAAGHTEVATAIHQQVARMTRQVDYHLAHARAAAAGGRIGARTLVAESVEGLARTLRRLYAERHLTIDVRVPAGDAVRGQREDVDEMLGNLIENACKWARTTVRVTSAAKDSVISIVVEDDGQGLDPSMREAVLQRGVRADQAAPGSGFGLAIVRDLAELYGGAIALGASDMGGVSATLRLPAAQGGDPGPAA